MLTLRDAKQIIGSIGFPTKMPGTSYGLPASACVAGAKLAKVSGSVCSKCYALSDRHAWINPVKAQHRRLVAIQHPDWVDAMVLLLRHIHAKPEFRIDLGIKNAKARGIIRFRYNQSGFHRWHDSGDIQSADHLAKICDVSRQTSRIKHWLPTQELGMVRAYLNGGGSIPSNLTVRVSSVLIDDDVRRSWHLTCSVFVDRAPSHSHVCPAPQQGHRCDACRACWSPDVSHVAYRMH